MNFHPQIAGKKLTANGVCERFSIVRRTLGRWMLDPEMQFPESLVLNGRHYWNESDIIAWERSRAALSQKAA